MSKSSYTDGFFNVSSEHGFLPIHEPLKRLPNSFIELQVLIDQLPNIITIPNEIVVCISLIPDYSEIIKNENDVFVLQALFRAYTFVTSAFTLEKAYQEFKQTGDYGKARRSLPSNISVPLVLVSEKLDVYPWLDYHYAYSLGNYIKKDKDGTFDWKNLNMACSFTGSKDEIGFIMVHVYINELSPKLVESVLEYNKNESYYKSNPDKIYWLKNCAETMETMNYRRREMWLASRHEHYNDFRVFIMGIKGNDSIFGDGLVYENCFDNQPQQFRGQTGAQDNIIPMIDIFSGIMDYYPENQLTDYLLDLRSYRPKCIQHFLSDIRDYYKKHPIYYELLETDNAEGLIYLLKIVDEVYLFRNGHWQFVQKYIMSNVKYAFATGGTPITTWLINQIEAVLEYERVLIQSIKRILQLKIISTEVHQLFSKLESNYEHKMELLYSQVNELKNIDYNIELVYQKNIELKLEDSSLEKGRTPKDKQA